MVGGRGTIVGTVLGVIIFFTLGNVFTLNDLSSSAQAVARGSIIVAAVLLQQRLATGSFSFGRPGDGAGVAAGSPAGEVSGGTSEPGGPGGPRPGATTT